MMWNIDGITWPGKLFTPWDRSSRDREPASRSWRRREAVTRDRVALRVEQDLEQVLGRELLMPLAQRERLGGLDEASVVCSIKFRSINVWIRQRAAHGSTQ